MFGDKSRVWDRFSFTTRPLTMLSAAAVCCIAGFVCGCTAASTPDAIPAPGPSPAVSKPAAPVLPAPADLPRQASSSFGFRPGSVFVDLWPNQLVTADESSALYEPTEDEGLAGAAFAIYSVSVPPTESPELELGWDAPAMPAGGCWVALANFAANRWDWFFLSDSSNLSLDQLDSYFGSGSFLRQVCVVVLLESGPPARLDWLRVGSNVEPTGSIYTEPGELPNSLLLQVTPRDSDGTVASFGWDFENDGTIDLWDQPEVEHTWSAPGFYTIAVHLTDNDGASGEIRVSRPVSPWRTEPQLPQPEWGCADALIDAAGLVHLAFLRDPNDDGQPPYDLLYATNPDGSWAEEPVCQVGRAGQPLLAESAGQAHIILLDASDLDEDVILHAWRDAGVWMNEQLADGNYGVRWRPDLALDGSGAVHIAYCASHDQNPDSIRYASSSGGFSFADVPLPAEPRHRLALAVDDAGRPHLVTTVELGWQQISCAYSHWDGAQWNSELVGDPSYDCTAFDILLDSEQRMNLLYLAEEDTGGVPPWELSLRLCSRTEGDWQFADFSPLDDLLPWKSDSARLALDAGGQMMLAIGRPNGWDWGLDGVEWFVYHDGSAWRSEVVEIQSIGGTLYGFGLDPQGRPWMCYDGEPLRLATRME